MVRIDESLLERDRVRRDLRRLLKQSDFTGLFDPNIDALREAVNATGQEVVWALFDILLEGRKPEDSLAYILLKDLDHELSATRAMELLTYPRLKEPQRGRLRDIVASWSIDLWAEEVTEPIASAASPEAQRLVELLSQKNVTEEEAGLVWVWARQMILPEVRCRLLGPVFALETGGALAIAALELVEGESRVLTQVARLLGTRPEVEADQYLQDLETHSDLMVREEAEAARRHRKRHEQRDPRPTFHGARIYESQSTGMHVLSFGVETTPGHGMAVSVIVDSWDGGLVDCWGQNRLLLRDMNVVFSAAGRLLEREGKGRGLTGREAAGWLFAAEKLSRDRSRSLPPQWPIWRRLLRSVREPIPPPGDVVFGLVCLECREPIRRDTSEVPGPLVVGPIALCGVCLEKDRTCSRCGRPVSPRKSHAVTHPHSPHLAFFCDSCYAKKNSRASSTS